MAVMLAVTMLLVGCTAQSSTAEPLRIQILATFPHDTSLYTEGLEIHDGVLYEGSGLAGQSRIRASTLSRGAVSNGAGSDGRVLREAALPAALFGEGLTVAGDRLWQLTWKDGIAIEWDPATLAQRRQVSYPGEGWGLCYDGHRLVMSNGSDQLIFRDPVTFAPSGQVQVRLDGESVRQLNELECAGGNVWANVFQSDRIMRIDPRTGTVTGVVDASDLPGAGQHPHGDVLNGIAAIPGTDEFLVTGKHWPTLFRVRFVPSAR